MSRECNLYSYIGFIFLYSHRIFLTYIIISFAAQALWQFLDESRNAPIDISYLSAEIELTECQLKQSLLNHSSISNEVYDYTAVFRDFEKVRPSSSEVHSQCSQTQQRPFSYTIST